MCNFFKLLFSGIIWTFTENDGIQMLYFLMYTESSQVWLVNIVMGVETNFKPSEYDSFHNQAILLYELYTVLHCTMLYYNMLHFIVLNYKIKIYLYFNFIMKIYANIGAQFVPLLIPLLALSSGVLRKRCSEKMQQIYRRTSISKCEFNKVALQLYWNQISLLYECSLVNLLHVFRTPFSKNISKGLLLYCYWFFRFFFIKL